MKTVQISLNSIDKVKSFVNEITKYDNDFDLVSGRYVIDAKSIMGIFSLDLSKPIDLNIHANGIAHVSTPVSSHNLVCRLPLKKKLMQSSLHLTRISSNNNSQTYLCVNAQCKKLSLLRQLFCNGDEPKPGIYQNFGSRLQSLNMPFGTFGDSMPLR